MDIVRSAAAGEGEGQMTGARTGERGQSLSQTNIELRIQGIYDTLSNAEKKAASYFLSNVEDVFNKPISQLASESGASKVAWVRFCKSLGFGGLKDLKKSLFNELYQTKDKEEDHIVFPDILQSEQDSIDQMILSVRNNSICAIQDTAKLLDPASVELSARKILSARSVRIFGMGASALVGEDLYSKLLRIDLDVRFFVDFHGQLTYAANMTPEDVAIIISTSGRTKESLEILDIANQCGAQVIALTSFSKSPLALGSDIQLYSSSPEVAPRSAAMSSRIAQMLAVDVLFSAVARLDYDRAVPTLENSLKRTQPHREQGLF